MNVLLRPGRNCESIEPAAASGLLIDARDYYLTVHAVLQRAQRSVLIAGWQFDSAVPLLRGADAEQAEAPVRLLPLIEHLLKTRPELHVYVLAWDYSLVFAGEREWLLRMRFDWMTDARLHFEFDGQHPAGASHHQKLVVVDGALAFAGGVDLCDARWDDRAHAAHNPERVQIDGEPHKPYHDVMAYCTGPAARAIEHVFCERWRRATGEVLQLPAAEPELANEFAFALERALPIQCAELAISLTYGAYEPSGTPKQIQILTLYQDAIASAERLVYIETQYFTSRALHDALCKRLLERGRAPLEVVIVLPLGADTPKENWAIGAAQNRVLSSLCEQAREHGHRVRVLCSAAPQPSGELVPTFIHSKLMIVDDRLLTVGSANCTNRSMSLDSELNLVWECGPDASRLGASIARIRASLLSEHAGIEHDAALEAPEGLVARIDALLGHSKLRLRELPDSPDDVEQNPLVEQTFDPDRALTDLDWEELILARKE